MKYKIIPNPNPNTKMTVNTMPRQIQYCDIVIVKHIPVHEVLGSVGVTIHYRTSSLASASNCIHALHKSNNIVTMPTRDVLLRHFCKMSLMVGICGYTLLSLMYSWWYPCTRYNMSLPRFARPFLVAWSAPSRRSGCETRQWYHWHVCTK